MTLMSSIASVSNVLLSSATSMLTWYVQIFVIPCIFGDICDVEPESIHLSYSCHWLLPLMHTVPQDEKFFLSRDQVALFFSLYVSSTSIIKLREILITICLFVTCKTWSFLIPVAMLSIVSRFPTYRTPNVLFIHSSGHSICLFISTVSWYLFVNLWFDTCLFFCQGSPYF